MFDSYSADQTSDMHDQMIDEGRNTDEDSTADSVQELYDILKHEGHPHDAIVEMITDTLKVDNPERYL